MQRIIRNTLAILLFLTAPAYAGGAMGLMMAGGSSAAAPSYIFNETFGGSTLCYTGLTSVCDNAWTYAGGSTFAAGSLTITGGGGNAYVDLMFPTTFWVAVKITMAAEAKNIIEIKDSGNTTIAMLTQDATPDIFVNVTGGSWINETTTLTAGNDYYIKLKVVTGGSSSAIGYWSTDGTNWTASSTSSNGATNTATRLILYPNNNNIVYKLVRVSSSDINF